ncbi:50S ribosomal protein L25 [Candidatus Uhrbacteria bacterium]|nr:50S ribosomal protein L25 [Candidatus Uhrbacteria bacterium]
MSEHILQAQQRNLVGRKTRQLRASGAIPAVVYGSGIQPSSITINRNAFLKTYGQAGESSIVELSIGESEPLHVLIQDTQIDPLLNEVTHVDFRSIDMNKEIEADVDLEVVGESPAVKALGGTLVLSRDYVTVRCLPAKLVRSLAVDISGLATFEDTIRVKDLVIPEGMTILDQPTLSIAGVEAPRSEEEMAELDKAVDVDVSAVEMAGKKKDEEEEAGEAGEVGEAGKAAQPSNEKVKA